jgi:predicted outer membrane protein
VLGNREEIAVAEFAQGRVQNDQVREFIAMIQRDHQQAVEKLRSAVPEIAIWNLDLNATAGQPGARTTQPTAAAAVGATAGTAAVAGQGAAGRDFQSQMLALQRTAAEQCLAITQRELGEQSGEEFDMAFLGQQIAGHIGMLAKLKASQQFASGNLRNVIQESTQVVERHLQQAKQIKQALKQSGAGRQSAQRDAARRQ